MRACRPRYGCRPSEIGKGILEPPEIEKEILETFGEQFSKEIKRKCEQGDSHWKIVVNEKKVLYFTSLCWAGNYCCLATCKTKNIATVSDILQEGVLFVLFLVLKWNYHAFCVEIKFFQEKRDLQNSKKKVPVFFQNWHISRLSMNMPWTNG